MVPQAIRHGVARAIGEKHFGMGQYLRDALSGSLRDDAAFNGQRGRRQLFFEIVRAFDVGEIVETGTFRGDTTAFMSRVTGRPVSTCESSPRHYGYARARFAFNPGIRVVRSDSRDFLRSHLGNTKARGAQGNGGVFAYLDAHWGPDLPLYEETRILFASRSVAVVMIDDFAVPDDSGYRFDSYGPAATLNLEYLRLDELPDVRIFFPRLRSAEETGARRGCVVLAQSGPAAAALTGLPSLRPWARP
jgi:hypothetical protein